MRIVKQRQVYWVDLEKVFPKDKHYQKKIVKLETVKKLT